MCTLTNCTICCFTEHEIVGSKDERAQDLSNLSSESKEELQRSVVVKMQAITKANENLCIALLEKNGYDLETSIEAFFQHK
jgi:UBA-like domain